MGPVAATWQKREQNARDVRAGRERGKRRAERSFTAMARSDQRLSQLPLTLRRADALPLQQQIALQIRQLVAKGILLPGTRVPSTRALADQLGVARNTTAIAYELLVSEGLLEVRSSAGTVVSDGLPEALAPAPQPGSSGVAARARAAAASLPERARPMRLFERGSPPLHDFRIGQIDEALFPLARVQALARRSLGRSTTLLGRYGDPAGLPRLRAAIVDHLRRTRGVRCAVEQVVIVAGAQEGLNLIARLLLAEGSDVVVENPCYEGAASVFASHGARLLPARVDEQGLLPDELAGVRASLAYVTPSHQFPLGFTLSLSRRLGLLDWAAVSGAYVIEDDYDSDFRYEGAPLMALSALDTHGSVIYLGTFSKSLGAGLRLGYAVFPEPLASAAVAAKSVMNNGHPALDQLIVAELLESGAFEQHVRRLRREYRLRRDTLVRALELHFGPGRIDGGEGGMHVAWHSPEWLPPAPALVEHARRRGVGVYSLESAPVHCAGLGGPAPGAQGQRLTRLAERLLLFGYPCLSPPSIQRAIAALASDLPAP
jgi:GntR family transcriptional regulator/MocR family aminotransferase